LLYKYNNYYCLTIFLLEDVTLKQFDINMDGIIDSLFSLLPLFYRKLIKVMHSKTGSNPINMEFHVLTILTNAGELPISVIGNRLGISRPNMTSLIDKLIERGYAQRFHDTVDRRVINIGITEKGKKLLAKRKSLVKGNMRKRLESLNSEELGTLQQSLENIKQIIAKINSE
jgi:DNA-binding MarR family transcriptional regulator